jgi:hypothetical protein
MRQFGKRFSGRRSAAQLTDTGGKRDDAATPPDVSSVRAKSQRHRKATADKWNQ